MVQILPNTFSAVSSVISSQAVGISPQLDFFCGDFGPGRSGEIGGRLAPGAVDISTHLEIRPERMEISNGLESLELTLAELRALASIPAKQFLGH